MSLSILVAAGLLSLLCCGGLGQVVNVQASVSDAAAATTTPIINLDLPNNYVYFSYRDSNGYQIDFLEALTLSPTPASPATPISVFTDAVIIPNTNTSANYLLAIATLQPSNWQAYQANSNSKLSQTFPTTFSQSSAGNVKAFATSNTLWLCGSIGTTSTTSYYYNTTFDANGTFAASAYYIGDVTATNTMVAAPCGSMAFDPATNTVWALNKHYSADSTNYFLLVSLSGGILKSYILSLPADPVNSYFYTQPSDLAVNNNILYVLLTAASDSANTTLRSVSVYNLLDYTTNAPQITSYSWLTSSSSSFGGSMFLDGD